MFTILTVTTVNKNVFSGANTSLPSQIFANASSPYVGAQARGWGAALTLIAIAFILMIVARLVTARFPETCSREMMETPEQNIVANLPQTETAVQQQEAVTRACGAIRHARRIRVRKRKTSRSITEVSGPSPTCR